MNAKRHHYVPQFYLRYFIQESQAKTGTFWVYDKEGGEPSKQTPKNTALKCGFYSFDTGNTNKDDDLEKAFSQIEGITKPILDHWQEPKVVPEHRELAEVAMFLAFLHTRVPRSVEAAKEMGLAICLAELERLAESPQEVNKIWSDMVKAEGLSMEEFQAFLRDPTKNFNIEMNEKMALAVSLLNATKIYPYLLDLHWCLCTAPDSTFFLTSDAPLNVCVLEGPYAKFGVGFGLEDVQVAFPISPKICLFLDRKHSQKRRRVNERFVEEINRRAVFIAEQYIISPLRTKRVKALVAEFSGTRRQPKMDKELIMKLHRAKYG